MNPVWRNAQGPGQADRVVVVREDPDIEEFRPEKRLEDDNRIVEAHGPERFPAFLLTEPGVGAEVGDHAVIVARVGLSGGRLAGTPSVCEFLCRNSGAGFVFEGSPVPSKHKKARRITPGFSGLRT